MILDSVRDAMNKHTTNHYVKIDTTGETVIFYAYVGETEKITFLTQNDGYLLLGEETVVLKKGDPVRVHLLPGLSSLY
jgi:hypothetical protein